MGLSKVVRVIRWDNVTNLLNELTWIWSQCLLDFHLIILEFLRKTLRELFKGIVGVVFRFDSCRSESYCITCSSLECPSSFLLKLCTDEFQYHVTPSQISFCRSSSWLRQKSYLKKRTSSIICRRSRYFFDYSWWTILSTRIRHKWTSSLRYTDTNSVTSCHSATVLDMYTTGTETDGRKLKIIES